MWSWLGFVAWAAVMGQKPMLANIRERLRAKRGSDLGDSGLWKKAGPDRWRRLIGLVPVLLAVAVHAVTWSFLLLGQLGLGGQQGGEGEEAGGGGDGGEGRLAQAQRQRGHGQGQALELRQLVSLELLLHRMRTRSDSDTAGEMEHTKS